MSNNKITVAVLCYGLYGHEYRTPEEVSGLIDYFYKVGAYIATLYKRNKLSGIVLCGGFTNARYPKISEAASSSYYLKNVLSTLHNIPEESINVCLEERSFNTAQNLVFTGHSMMHGDSCASEELIETLKIDQVEFEQVRDRWLKLSHNIVFVCDRYRWLKVKAMLGSVKRLLSQDFKLNVKSFPRKDIHPNSSYSKQVVAASLYRLNSDKFFDDLKVNQ